MSDFSYQHDLLYEGGGIVDAIRQYILSVICVVILCGLAQILFSGSSSLVKLITGLVVTITVISPLLRNGKLSLDIYFDQITIDSQWAVKEGEEAAMQTTCEFIKEKTETYILDKAAELGAGISVEVSVDEDTPPVPDGVTVKGTVSPYTKKQLIDCISQELGIAEEDQVWIS